MFQKHRTSLRVLDLLQIRTIPELLNLSLEIRYTDFGLEICEILDAIIIQNTCRFANEIKRIFKFICEQKCSCVSVSSNKKIMTYYESLE